jgi:hypothetical protein
MAESTFIIPMNLSTVTVREQTGEDEELLTRNEYVNKGESVLRFLQSIIISGEMFDNRKPTLDELKNTRTSILNYLLFRSRIFSLGAELKFVWQFKDNRGNMVPYDMVEDLTPYYYEVDADAVQNLKSLLATNPSEYQSAYNEWASKLRAEKDIRKVLVPTLLDGNELPTGKGRELTLPSGRKVRYQYITSNTSKYLLEQDEKNISLNDLFYARVLEMLSDDGRWLTVKTLRPFTSKELATLRGDINTYDSTWEPKMTVPNPHGEDLIVDVMGLSDFFFPALT